jgi:hypothetical protein
VGTTVPLLITRAAVLLALDELGAGASSDGATSNVSSKVKSLSVEGLSVTYRDPASGIVSTGNDKADDLIDLAVGTSRGSYRCWRRCCLAMPSP